MEYKITYKMKKLKLQLHLLVEGVKMVKVLLI